MIVIRPLGDLLRLQCHPTRRLKLHPLQGSRSCNSIIMRPYRALSARCPLPHSNSVTSRPPSCVPLCLSRNGALRHASVGMPKPNMKKNRVTRWIKYEDLSEPIKNTPSYRNPLNYIEYERQAFRRSQLADKRLWLYGSGIVFLFGVQIFMMYFMDQPQEMQSQRSEKESASTVRSVRDLVVSADRLDAPAGRDAGIFEGKKVVEKPGLSEIKIDENGRELVDTGTSTIPYYPRTIDLPTGQNGAQEEYQLLGLGIRTVFYIQVYVLGLYVKTSDMADLQTFFVKHINPLGTSLIPQEKAQLKKDLLDPEKSYAFWEQALRDAKVKHAVRIVPTRNTDVAHLRDGFVTGITQRVQAEQSKGSQEYMDDEKFGMAMRDFKAMMTGKGSAPKGSALILTRGREGELDVWFHKKASEAPGEKLGTVMNELISRQIWLGYVGGKKVSSEAVRKNVVDGVLDLVERPVGIVGMEIR